MQAFWLAPAQMQQSPRATGTDAAAIRVMATAMCSAIQRGRGAPEFASRDATRRLLKLIGLPSPSRRRSVIGPPNFDSPAHVYRRCRRRTATPPSASRRTPAASTPLRDIAGAGAVGFGEQTPALPGLLLQDCPGGQEGSAQQTSSTQFPDLQSVGSSHAPPLGLPVPVGVTVGVVVGVPVVVGVRVTVAVLVPVLVDVTVGVLVDVRVGVEVGVIVGVLVGVRVGVTVGV
jgi:hypothetical protein